MTTSSDAPAGAPPAPASNGTDPAGTTPPADAPADEPADDDEPLGPPGKRALDAEREKRKQATAERDALRAELDELRAGQMSEHEKAVADARKEGAAEADAKWRDQVADLAVRNAAAGKFASPDIAARLIDDVPFDADGRVDTAALDKAIDAALEAHPELAAKAAPRAVPAGVRGASESTPDMNTLLRAAAGRGA